jgi:SH3 domain-containing YSC84-like protein 1
MKNYIFIFALLFPACTSSPFSEFNPFEHTELLLDSEETLDGLISDPDDEFPRELLSHTKAIVVFPNIVKAAIIAGARIGKGVVIVRSPKTPKWNPPAFIKSRPGSWGI